ncbi:DUF1178 family protein [Candidatus Pelagibacter sp.]|nr:DUF1178 family protein [Candidatus Pelagibacter sp.]
MIKYKLICKNCELSFDSWFSNSMEFDRLKKKNFLICHNCNSKKIEKTLMAPKMIAKNFLSRSSKEKEKIQVIKKTIKEYKKFIKNNFEYVGKNFAYEARSIHYENKKKDKGIYGSVSKEELKDLKEEGIETHTIPWLEDNNN